jgi:hypothetical protein
LNEIPPSHGSQSKQANLCPVQYATGGILNPVVIFVKLLAQNFREIFGWPLLSLKMAVKQNDSPYLFSRGHCFSLSMQARPLGQVYATGAEFCRVEPDHRLANAGCGQIAALKRHRI